MKEDKEFNQKWRQEIENHKHQLSGIYKDIVFPQPPYTPEKITVYVQEVRPYLRRALFYKRVIPITFFVLLLSVLWTVYFFEQSTLEDRVKQTYSIAQSMGWEEVEQPLSPYNMEKVHTFEQYVWSQYVLYDQLRALQKKAKSIDWAMEIEKPPYQQKHVGLLEDQIRESIYLHKRVLALQEQGEAVGYIMELSPPFKAEKIAFYESRLDLLQPYLKKSLSYKKAFQAFQKSVHNKEKSLMLEKRLLKKTSFMMGCDGCYDDDDKPRHKVTLTAAKRALQMHTGHTTKLLQ